MDKPNEIQAKTEKTSKKTGRSAGKVNFPKHSLENALRVPRCIWENNSGNPMTLLDIATKLGYSVMSTSFADLIRSSLRYGLTDGSWSQTATKIISLNDLGRSIVAPTMEDNANENKMKALLTPRVFSKLYSEIDGKIIPPEDMLKNTLTQIHHIDLSDKDICSKVFMKNIDELDISEMNGKRKYLMLKKLASKPPQQKREPEGDEETDGEGYEDNDEQNNDEQNNDEPENKLETKSTSSEKIQSPKVFISHSKNKKITEQLEQILKIAKMDYKLAKDTPEKAVFLLTKVFDLLKECNCAIINISADDEGKKENGEYDINENVLIEIGASYGYFKENIILLVDSRIKLPSMLEGVHVCKYNGDELSFDNSLELQRAIDLFKN